MSARLRPGVLALAVLVVIVAAGTWVAGQAGPLVPPDRRTESVVTPTVRQVVCPGSSGASTSSVGLLPETKAGGSVRTGDAPLDLAPGALKEIGPATDPLVISTSGAATRGVFADRVDPTGGVARCVSPRASFWFTGAGADQAHASTLTISNPRTGPAVVDVSVYAADGPVSAPGLRGLALKPGQVRTLRLASVAPTAGAVAVHVQVSRGLVAAAIEDQAIDALTKGAIASRDWIPDQSRPARHVVLSGLAPPAVQQQALSDATLPKELSSGAGLSIANPGTSSAVVQVGVATPSGTVQPTSSARATVPARSVVTLPVTTTDPASALVVTSDHPVTAGYALPTRTDLVHATPAVRWRGSAAAAAPSGAQSTLVLTGAGKRSSITVTQLGARGKQIAASRVRVADGVTRQVSIRPDAASVVVGATGNVYAALSVQQDGRYSSLPLSPVLAGLRVPAVRPGG